MSYRGRGRGGGSSTQTHAPRYSSGTSMRVGSAASKPKHVVEYAKSARSGCKTPSCAYGPIPAGELRYGLLTITSYGENYVWRHWRSRCMTKSVMQTLKQVGAGKLGGMSTISQADQLRVRGDINAGCVRPEHERTVAEGGRAGTVPVVSTPAAPVATSSKRPLPQDPESAPAPALYNYPFAEEVDENAAEPEPEPEPVEEIYIRYQTEVVGVQHYHGMVADGERVNIRREPLNQYDRNAFQVVNISGNQVGHIKRDVAARLAPLYDAGRVTLEGIMLRGNLAAHYGYTLPIEIRILGQSDQRTMLEPALIYFTPRSKGFTADMLTAEYTENQARGAAPAAGVAASRVAYGANALASGSQIPMLSPADQAKMQALIAERTKALELAAMIEGLGRVNDEDRRTGVLDALCGIGAEAKDVLKLPVLELDRHPKGLRSTLLKHQSQALRWCLEKENPVLPSKEGDPAVQFWQYKKASGKPYWYNIVAHTPMAANTPPALGRGGLIADAMGLGKTLTMLALILATKDDVAMPGHCESTLIVAPLSVLSNWEKQIVDHVQKGKLKVHVYYGAGRDVKAEKLENVDVVITTYQIVAQDYLKYLAENAANAGEGGSRKKRKYDGGLNGVKWRRIILDEGHSIRNAKTKMAQAVYALEAERRWVVSGTPIINSPRDLGSLITFLRLCTPLDKDNYFKSLLIRPLTAGTTEGVALLRSLMSNICLRRTKEMQHDDGSHLVELPPVRMTQVTVTLPDDVRQLYNEIEDLSRQRFEHMLQRQELEGGGNVMASGNVLSMLTRLRQLVLHPGLIPRNYLEQLRNGVRVAAVDEPAHGDRVAQIQITAQDKIRLQALLAQAIEESEECPVCFEVLCDPRITPCAHMFCLACISEVIRRDTRCPMDRRSLSLPHLIEPLPPTEATQRFVGDLQDGDEETNNGAMQSAKIDQLITLLKLQPRGDKSLVFSQFTGFLDKIEEALDAAGIAYVRLDGKLSAKRRAEVIKQFCVPLPGSNNGKKTSPTEIVAAAAAETASTTSAAQQALVPEESVVKASQVSLKRALQGSQAASIQSVSSAGRPSRAAATGKAKQNRMVIDDSDDEEVAAEPAPEPVDEDYEYQNDADENPASDIEVNPADFFSDDDDNAYVGKGKGKAKARSSGSGSKGRSYIDALDGGRIVNPPVMLISLKAGALGLNLTVANNVFLMDPWWQEGIESQAIDRCNRIGQTKEVNVYQLVAENTVEQKVLEIQNRKKELIKHAFSGFKSRETQTEKREARMAELLELLGSRRREQEEQAGPSNR